MNKTILFAILPLLLLTACNTQPAGITLKVAGLEDVSEAKLFSLSSGEKMTATKQEDGTFRFPDVDGFPLDFYRINLDKVRSVVFLADSTTSMTISAQADDFKNTLKVEGSEMNESYLMAMKKANDYNDQMVALQKKAGAKGMSKIEIDQLQSEFIDLGKQRRNWILSEIEKSPENVINLELLNHLDINRDLAQYEKVLASTAVKMSKTKKHKAVKTQVEGKKRQAQQKRKLETAPPQNRQAKNSKYTAGMMAPDIVMADVKGKIKSLSALKGKVVLMDFWASWCGPCRRENPNVVKAYNKYNKDGFEVFSISFDKQKEPWLKAIEKDGLIWENHVSDLKGWQCAAAGQYGISSIPHTILLDRTGKIIDTNMRGAKLEDALAEIFGY